MLEINFFNYLTRAHAQVQIASARLSQIGTVTRTTDGGFIAGPIPGIGGPFDTAASFRYPSLGREDALS